MPPMLETNQRPFPPAVVHFAVAAFICGFLIFSLYAVTVYREVGRQQEFLAAHGEPNSYLVPVDCGDVPRGKYEIDYLRGTARIRGDRHRRKEVCWYSPSTYDRLFSGIYPESGAAAHVAQASDTSVDLLLPSFSPTLRIGAGLVMFAAFGVAVIFLKREHGI
ncbi:MAG: hypothetical protein JWM58_1667 [Rhizobium sp.]|nr:hypothetical protein [Rhizobium sp.]